MTSFYTDVTLHRGKMLMRGIENGIRVQEVVEDFKPYLFIPTKQESEFKTLQGQNVKKKFFDDYSDAREFVKKYKSLEAVKIYGQENFPYVYINDTYTGMILHDPKLINLVYTDIEVASDKGFPDIQKADKEVTAITLRKDGVNVAFGCFGYKPKPGTKYVQCVDERQLLRRFLDTWEEMDPDVVTGWNIEMFDIPYLVNRIRNVLGIKHAKRLSPWGILEEKKIFTMGREQQTFIPIGVAILDYLPLYKKFSFKNEESYKLDNIAFVVLGERKLEYEGSLLDLYRNDFQKFMDYNIWDTELIERLEKRLGFIEQVYTLAYDAKVNYNDTLATVKPWDMIIHSYLLERGIVIPIVELGGGDGKAIEGGFVKDPIVGKHKWLVSFDFDSLYPSLIQFLNIGPDTFIEKVIMPTVRQLLNSKEFPETEHCLAANGCKYSREKLGFLSALMTTMYADRKKYKGLMIEAEKKFEATKDDSLKDEITRYKNLQQAKKIQLNACYGALLNAGFRWFDNDNGEAVTKSGQLCIQWVANAINAYLNKILNTQGADYVVAIDTDSCYVNLGPFVSAVGMDGQSDLEIVEFLDKVATENIVPVIKKACGELAELMKAKMPGVLNMKRESICDTGIWTCKKHYILSIWDNEGVRYDKQKIKITGMESARSSTPYVCREELKKAYKIALHGSQSEMIKCIGDFKKTFLKLSVLDIASPRGVKDIGKWKHPVKLYAKGTPIQARASMIYNKMLEDKNLTDTHPMIYDGDKIKFIYLRLPNPTKENVIAFHDGLPAGFDLEKYVDRKLQFEKMFLNPITNVLNVVGWENKKKNALQLACED